MGWRCHDWLLLGDLRHLNPRHRCPDRILRYSDPHWRNGRCRDQPSECTLQVSETPSRHVTFIRKLWIVRLTWSFNSKETAVAQDDGYRSAAFDLYEIVATQSDADAIFSSLDNAGFARGDFTTAAWYTEGKQSSERPCPKNSRACCMDVFTDLYASQCLRVHRVRWHPSSVNTRRWRPAS